MTMETWHKIGHSEHAIHWKEAGKLEEALQEESENAAAQVSVDACLPESVAVMVPTLLGV